MNRLQLGSGPLGQPLFQLLCANTCTATQVQCSQVGKQTCSKCYLVQYCSKDCQVQHWKVHRDDCKGPLISASWVPAWFKEKRAPDWIDNSPSLTFSHTSFGLPLAYLWGNLPAIDCVNLPDNEQKSEVTHDLKLCFAASGDIRNLIRTVNCLPENYSGQCNILFNDFNPLVVGHNVMVLWALLNPDLSIDGAAELAVHLMYSSRLTPEMSEFLSSKGIQFLRDLNLTDGRGTSVPINGKGQLHLRLDPGDLDITIEMLGSTYRFRAASYAYARVMCNSLRQDYIDRHLNNLEPCHRLAFSYYRVSGILAPFSLDVSHFVEPNRLLFSPHGDWLMSDNNSPIYGWDMSLVFAYAEKHKLNRADAYGCLFFYLKNELSIFAKRLRDFRINITMTMLDAVQDLPNRIASPTILPSFSFKCFDRIETSNLADYVPAPRILSAWSPFLNRDNKFATILMNFMNWQQYHFALPNTHKWNKPQIERYASIMGVGIQSILMSGGFTIEPTISPALTRFHEGMQAFIDDHESFQSFLRDQCIEKAADACGLQLRKINRIHPKRAGATLSASRLTTPEGLTKAEFYNTFWIGGSETRTRFVEFECAKN